MFYMLDNYDSFVYNLAAYLREAGQEVLVRRADEMSLDEIYELQPKGILLSRDRNVPLTQPNPDRFLRNFKIKYRSSVSVSGIR